MAASLNRVFLMGNLTRNPELRYVPSGTAVATFGLAVNRVYNTQAGERKEEVCFVQIVVWGRRAELCGEYLSKGSPIFVEGRLQYRSWEDQNGQKRNTIEVVANSVQFLGRGTKESADTHPPQVEDAPDIAPSVEDADASAAQSANDKNDKKETSAHTEEAPF